MKLDIVINVLAIGNFRLCSRNKLLWLSKGVRQERYIVNSQPVPTFYLRLLMSATCFEQYHRFVLQHLLTKKCSICASAGGTEMYIQYF